MTIFTIGYEGLSIDEFMALLSDNGVDTVVDVREFPLSRKRGFSKNALANTLHEAGLEYVHMVNLGCPKPVRNQYREDGDWKRYTIGFLKHLKKQTAAITELAELAQSSNCVLLCYEADYNYCHRLMVANAVRELCGAAVKHLKKAATAVKTKTSAVSPQLALT